MVGTNITFFAMILLGYGGMPRRYATYLPQFATLHQIATLGALMLLVGGAIFVYNIVVSWIEGPAVESGDPWELERDNLLTNEWQWHDRKLQTTLADGGEEVATDGGRTDE
jgi:cytochrome c oxidase subunit 1